SYGASTSLDSSLATQHSQTISGLTAATQYHYRVHSHVGSNPEALSSDLTFTTTDQTPVSSADFDTRCKASGEVRCFGFDSASETDPHIMAGGGYPKLGTIVSDVKASGAGSLRFEIPSQSHENAAGSFWLDFVDDNSVQFGEGQEFFV